MMSKCSFRKPQGGQHLTFSRSEPVQGEKATMGRKKNSTKALLVKRSRDSNLNLARGVKTNAGRGILKPGWWGGGEGCGLVVGFWWLGGFGGCGGVGGVLGFCCCGGGVGVGWVGGLLGGWVFGWWGCLCAEGAKSFVTKWPPTLVHYPPEKG